MTNITTLTLIVFLAVGAHARFKRFETDDARAARLFKAHCLACHSSSSLTPLPFGNIAQLKSYRDADGNSVRDLIANRRMPRLSNQVPPLADEDRAFLVRYLQ